MKFRYSSLVASLSVIGLTGCHSCLGGWFRGAPCATCAAPVPAATAYAPSMPCADGCEYGSPVVSGMMPGGDYMMGDGVVGAPWGGDIYGGVPVDSTVVGPATNGGMAPLPAPNVVTPPR